MMTSGPSSLKQDLIKIFGFDKQRSINDLHCIPNPYGCGKPITGFVSKKSEREYGISGLCQKCQDEIFGKEE